MCDHCHFPHRPETRRSFLRKLACAAAAPAVLGAGTRLAAAPAPRQIPSPGWARLATPSPYWRNHLDQDDEIADFIRSKTPYRLAGSSSIVQLADPDSLRHFPFIFTNGLLDVREPAELTNLREYLFGGGFLYVDYCSNVISDPDSFYQFHANLFSHLLAGVEIRQLQPDHPLFRSYFRVEDGMPAYRGDHETRDLFGVYDDDRMLAILSLEHLLCGWPQAPMKKPIAQHEIADMYVYARQQSAPPSDV